MRALVLVHDRILKRHPGIEKQDVINAWNNLVCKSRRMDGNEEYYSAVGFDRKGRALEMIALETFEGYWFVFHAMTPPTKKILKELGLSERYMGHGN